MGQWDKKQERKKGQGPVSGLEMVLLSGVTCSCVRGCGEDVVSFCLAFWTAITSGAISNKSLLF